MMAAATETVSQHTLKRYFWAERASCQLVRSHEGSSDFPLVQDLRSQICYPPNTCLPSALKCLSKDQEDHDV